MQDEPGQGGPGTTPLNKHELSERDICTRYILPALEPAGRDSLDLHERNRPSPHKHGKSHLNDSDSDARASRESAERIAKEGRKCGISLTVISQRPREVSATILSQCDSFLCLRLSNPDDQSYVRNLLPDSIRGITSMFSTLRRGEGILLGNL
jgi:hypothetical protein